MRLSVIFLFLAVSIGTLGYSYYVSQRDHIRREVHDDLLAIADLKVSQIVRWRKERLMDAEYIMSAPHITDTVNLSLKSQEKPKPKREVLAWMRSLSKVYDFRNIFLLDPQGLTRLSVSTEGEVAGDVARGLAAEALRSGKAILSDLYRHQESNHIHIDLCVPILSRRGGLVHPVAVLVMRIDPHEFLYPFIQTWPTPSPTAESLLVRREGDDVLYLNDLRHSHKTALTLRLPLKDEKMPAAMAVRGKEGIVEGVDYRSVPVLAAIRRVPGSQWFLISKVDADEIYAPIRERFWAVMIITMLLIATAGAGLSLLRRQELVKYYRDARNESERLVRERTAELTDANRRLESEIAEHRRTEEALGASESKYRSLVETMNEGLAVQDENGILTYVNNKICEMLGYTQDEIIGRPAAEFFSDRGRQVYAEQMVRRRSGQEEPYEITLVRKDGREIHAIVSPKAQVGKDGELRGSFGLIMDITQRRRAEEALSQSEEQLRRLSYEILTVQETERRRISRELHDQLGQDLTLAKLMLRSVEKALPDQGEGAKDECEDLLEFIDQVIENVRRLSRDLSPAILEDVGLTAALQWLTKTFAENSGLRVRSDIAHIDHLVSKHAHIMLYRVLQEALTNIAKHAGAQNVHVAIRADDDRVSFSVEDDGEGIESERTGARDRTQQSLGITIMEERVRFMGGGLDVWSQPGKGTRIAFTIPLEKA